MTLEQIEDSIRNYQQLISLVESKLNVLIKADNEIYFKANGIESIDFEEDIVSIKVDISRADIKDYDFIEFPVEWLTFSNVKLSEIAITEKELRLEKQRKDKELLDMISAKEKERYELDLLQRLKEKYNK